MKVDAYDIAKAIDEAYKDQLISGSEFLEKLDQLVRSAGHTDAKAIQEVKKEVLQELKEIRRLRIGAVA